MKEVERPYGPDGARTIWHIADKNARGKLPPPEEKGNYRYVAEYRTYLKERYAIMMAVELLSRNNEDLTIENMGRVLGYTQQLIGGKYPESAGLRILINKHGDLVREINYRAAKLSRYFILRTTRFSTFA